MEADQIKKRMDELVESCHGCKISPVFNEDGYIESWVVRRNNCTSRRDRLYAATYCLDNFERIISKRGLL